MSQHSPNFPSTYRLAGGRVLLDQDSAAPLQFIHDAEPERRYLLDDSVAWHTAEHQWGSGHVVTSAGAGRWSDPQSVHRTDTTITVDFAPVAGVAVTVERDFGAAFVERFRWTNVSGAELEISGLGIHTPFADLYEDAESAIHRSVHAHVQTGGTWSWVLAQPMSGTGASLVLTVRRGALAGYSVESRNDNTGSNARGHIVLQLTDHARNPSAFAGQPLIHLAPGDSHVLEWDVRWFASREAFLAAEEPPAVLAAVSAPTGEPLFIRTERIVSSPTLTVTPVPGGFTVTAQEPGNYLLHLSGDAHTELSFHAPLATTVSNRVRYIRAHHLSRERPGQLAHALLPVDTRTGLTHNANGWLDWSDGAERLAMPILLQLALRRGWADAGVEELLINWTAFARTHLLTDDFSTHRGSHDTSRPRLYDTPWFARYFVERYEGSRNPEDLDAAARVLERARELGIARFLAIGWSEVSVDVAGHLAAAGQAERAARLRDEVVASARHFAALGDALPPHEVSYEQSMLAPLVNLFIDAHRLTADPLFYDALAGALPKLLAFGGPQPHARLRHVGLRHWDGFWFGIRRQWGDVFPHHWAVLTAGALARLPEGLRTDHTDAATEAILRAGMANFFPDGSATCAFVFPTAVDGAPAHTADPLANDQDWHLVMWLLLQNREGLMVS